MSLKSLPLPPMLEKVVCIVHVVFSRGNVFKKIRDTLGTIDIAEAFADLFPTHGQPVEALVLVNSFQLLEGLIGSPGGQRCARSIGLEHCDADFDYTVLVPRFVRASSRARLSSAYLLRPWNSAERMDS